ncbi:hypothetical protein AALA36_02045 [Lachnospiraceae bacterium 66-29]
MKKYKRLSYFFLGLAILLSNFCAATVAFNYCNLQWMIIYQGFSAPASIAFFLIIPYTVGIIICLIFAWFFFQKYQKSMNR